MEDKEIRFVGGISNFYGGLNILKSHDKYYWGIECSDGTIDYKGIPKKFYDEIVLFENKRTK